MSRCLCVCVCVCVCAPQRDPRFNPFAAEEQKRLNKLQYEMVQMGGLPSTEFVGSKDARGRSIDPALPALLRTRLNYSTSDEDDNGGGGGGGSCSEEDLSPGAARAAFRKALAEK